MYARRDGLSEPAMRVEGTPRRELVQEFLKAERVVHCQVESVYCRFLEGSLCSRGTVRAILTYKN